MKINELVGEYPVDVKNFRTDRKDWLRDEIFAMSRKQWQVVKWLLKEQEWDYFHYVDIGLDRVHHVFGGQLARLHLGLVEVEDDRADLAGAKLDSDHAARAPVDRVRRRRTALLLLPVRR